MGVPSVREHRGKRVERVKRTRFLAKPEVAHAHPRAWHARAKVWLAPAGEPRRGELGAEPVDALALAAGEQEHPARATAQRILDEGRRKHGNAGKREHFVPG